jgi:ATP-binding cassette subfamily G (WHITE) protein 2 (SNQ2)
MERKPGSSIDHVEEEPLSEKKFQVEEKSKWPITEQVQKLLERNGERPKSLGVTWSNLTVKGVSSDAVFNENVLSQFNPFGKSDKHVPLKTIIHNSSGCVKPGGMFLSIQLFNNLYLLRLEMLLVLGNPGAGCTSLLNILSNRRLGYAEVDGEVSFGAMSSDEAKSYRGQIIMVLDRYSIRGLYCSLTRITERRRRSFLSSTLGRTYTRLCYTADGSLSIANQHQLG